MVDVVGIFPMPTVQSITVPFIFYFYFFQLVFFLLFLSLFLFCSRSLLDIYSSSSSASSSFNLLTFNDFIRGFLCVCVKALQGEGVSAGETTSWCGVEFRSCSSCSSKEWHRTILIFCSFDKRRRR